MEHFARPPKPCNVCLYPFAPPPQIAHFTTESTFVHQSEKHKQPPSQKHAMRLADVLYIHQRSTVPHTDWLRSRRGEGRAVCVDDSHVAGH